MFDNLPFKTRDTDTINNFLKSGLLKPIDENVSYCERYGTQYTIKRQYKYYNLHFTINYASNGVYKDLTCRGSFHYLMNFGKHNADKINLITATDFLLKFAETFNIDLYKLDLLPPEFGLNINIPFDIIEVIDYTLCETRKMFANNPPHVTTSKISGSPKNDIRQKFYSKTHDCPKHAEINLLRAELKYQKVRGLKKIGIATIGDLLDKNNWIRIRDIFMQNFKQIVIYDYTIKEPNNRKIKDKLREYKKPKYWKDLIRDCREKKCSEDKYNDKIKDLNKLSKRYGSNLKQKIIETLYKQWDWFFENQEHPMYAQLFKPMYAPFIGDINNNINNNTPRICPETMLDISMQKDSSNLLSNAGLKYYEKHKPKLYKRLVETLLTGHDNKFEKDIYTRLSKQIRNRYYNNRSLYLAEQTRLF